MPTVALTQKQFIRRAKEIHGTEYLYKQVVYVTTKIPVTITCRKHGDFLQKPSKHLLGQGCPICADEQHSLAMSSSSKMSEKEFLKQLKLPAGQQYIGPFINLTTKVRLSCLKHGCYQKRPQELLNGKFCQSCGKGRINTAEFIKLSRSIFGQHTYDYSRTVYKNVTSPVVIVCKEHGPFKKIPSKHLDKQQGCPKCSRQGIGQEQFEQCQLDFVKRARQVHGKEYDYSKSVYLGRHRKLEIVCKLHGSFWQSAGNHLNGQGCPGCSRQGHSKIAIKWIELEAKRRRMKNVQHAENGGEFRIPGTRFSADGYHKGTKTVFEFYGDIFHGNLKVFKPTDTPNYFDRTLTTAQLYARTMAKEKKLQALGYNVISIWESDFRLAIKKEKSDVRKASTR
jgi:G:T-mismatch repair DNA endonuclease (very short patch repair protein)